MAKLILNDIGSFLDYTTAKATVNANNALIEAAVEKTLSRDGTTPNTMTSQFDMNSWPIVNLPAPINVTSPVRLQDLSTFSGGGTIATVPAGGTTGQPLVKNSNTNYDMTWAPFSGSGNFVKSSNATMVAPNLGTPASGTLTNCTGLTIASGLSGAGPNVITFLLTPASNVLRSAVADSTGIGSLVFQNGPTMIAPLLGTPASGVLTNCTGTAAGLTAGNVTTNANLTGVITSVGNATSLGSFTSANLSTALTDETGTGSAVFGTSPTLKTLITITANAGTPVPAATAGTVLRVVGVDASTARLAIESYGTGAATAFSTVNMRRANGTAAVPSAVQSGDLLFGVIGTGYGNSLFQDTAGAGMLGWASQTWSNTVAGTELAFAVTLNGATANGEALRILNTGQLKLTSASNFIANNTVATVLGSLGPTGSHTTVQKWLTIVDNTGTTLYIPAF